VGVGAPRGWRATLIVAFIVVSFGAGANQLAVAVIGGVGAVALVGAIGAAADPDLRLPQASIRG
jgi:hypothetical protein